MLWYANRQSGEFQTFVFEGSTPSRSTSIRIQPSGGTGRHATLRMSCPHAACEFNSRLGYFNIAGATGVQLTVIRSVCSARYRDLQLSMQTTTRMGQCSARPHKPGPPGATPGSATFIRPGTQTGKAVTLRAWRFCGFDPHLGHWQKMIAWSSGEDACVTCRRTMVRFHPRSLLKRQGL